MWVVVVAEAFVVAVLAVLVIGLLRSNAELARRVDALEVEQSRRSRAGDGRGTEPAGQAAFTAPELVGDDPAGESVTVPVANVGHTTLLAFLSSNCLTCDLFWQGFARGTGDLPGEDLRVVAVTKGPELEERERVATLAPDGLTTVLSTEAWDDYDVPISPYFVRVDGPSGAIVGEGAAASWEQLLDLLEER